MNGNRRFNIYFTVLLITAGALLGGCYLPPEGTDNYLKITINENSPGIIARDMLINLTLDPVNGTSGTGKEKDLFMSNGSIVTGFAGLMPGDWELGFKLYEEEDAGDLVSKITLPLVIVGDGENSAVIDIDYELFSDEFVVSGGQESLVAGPEFAVNFDAAVINSYDATGAAAFNLGYAMVAGFIPSTSGSFEFLYPEDGTISKDFADIAVITPPGYSYNDPYVEYIDLSAGISSGSFTFRVFDNSTGYYEMKSQDASAEFQITDVPASISYTNGAENHAEWEYDNPAYVHTCIILFCYDSGTEEIWLDTLQLNDMSAPFNYVPNSANVMYILAVNAENRDQAAGYFPDFSGMGDADMETVLGWYIRYSGIRFKGISVYKTSVSVS